MKPLAMRPARLLALALPLLCAGAATADTYPAKPVTLIVPQAPGGANDTIARIYAAKMSDAAGAALHRGQPAGRGRQHRHRGGRPRPAGRLHPDPEPELHAGGEPGAVCQGRLRSGQGFPAGDDARQRGLPAGSEPGFAPNSVTALIAQAKAQPGQVAYASAGNGTLNHLLGEMLKARAGVDMVHVPYKGAAAAVTDVVGGRVPVSFQSAPSAMPFVKSGKLKVLGVANEKRMASQPDIPPLARACPASAPRRGMAYSRRPQRRPRWWPSCTRPAPRRLPAPMCRRNWPSRAPSRLAWGRHPLPRRSRMIWRAGPRWSGKPARRSTERHQRPR